MKFLRLIIIMTLISCNNYEARYPVNYTDNRKDDNSIVVNRIIIDQNEKIDIYISKNKENNYINSKKGFWYFYKKKNDSLFESTQFGDLVTYNYSVEDLNNDMIYDAKSIGDQSYIMGKQEIISGLREALQVLKNGETATFIFPSYKAYGIYGDLNKISPNTPIICTIKVKSIISSKN
ncbi:gliding motility-associated peptidyl-prolyl isomerase GldI [Flavobacteriaceae bacterium]|nr:gliding motility-associated peptidyl-prolyl isomerase GldI [Flavobacteriaceae bacterium]